jgi:glycosyltransferase involved in cell wall biosynthesis
VVQGLKVSIIIPTINEEKSIGSVLDEIQKSMGGSGIEYEILVVDTNSKDRTREISREKGALVVEEPHKGYGRAYKTGFEKSSGEVIATLDADCTYPAGDILRLRRMLFEENLDFITTNRFGKMDKRAMSAKHRFGNWVLTTATNVLFGVKLKDSQSGMWVFRKECLQKLQVNDDGMPFSEEIKIEAFKKVRSKEVPIHYRQRVGEVKLSSWKDGRKNLAFLLKKRFSSAR